MIVRRSLIALLVLAPALPARALDVAPLDRVLREYVSGGRVDYAALAADAEAKADLDRFLADVAAMPDDPTGCEVRVRLALPGRETRELPGRIVFVDPQINAVNGQYRVWAEVENPDGLLRPGHRARGWTPPSDPSARWARDRSHRGAWQSGSAGQSHTRWPPSPIAARRVRWG